jgi:outer membrane protein assembly factor BamB
VLTLSPLLTAVDVRTGEVLWQRGDGGYLQPAALPLRLDGQVVLPEQDRLLGVDVRNGEVRWSVPAPQTTQTLFSRPLTDGRRLVLTDLDDSGALVLRAVDLATGADVWRVPATPSALWVYGVGGRGVMQGGGDVVVLG